MSPREWDNVGTMVCLHKRYTLGDKHTIESGDFDGWEAVEQHLRDECGATVVLPIYMLDHSGIAVSTTPFGCRWDSGQLGLIYTTTAKLAEFGVTPENAEAALVSEVETYNTYVSGEIYGYTVEDEQFVDSCGGFFSEEEAREEAEQALQSYLENRPRPCVQQVTACSP